MNRFAIVNNKQAGAERCQLHLRLGLAHSVKTLLYQGLRRICWELHRLCGGGWISDIYELLISYYSYWAL